LRRLPTFQPRLRTSTSGFHRQLHLRLCPPINLGLASPIDLQASPSNPASDSQSARCVLLASSSNQPLTCASSQPSDSVLEPNLRPNHRFAEPSGSAFRSASSLRLLPIFRPCLRTQPPTFIGRLILRLPLPFDLRLASPIDFPVLPATQPLTSIGGYLPAVPSTNYRLASAINQSAVPVIIFRLPSNIVPIGFAFLSTSGLRLRQPSGSAFRPIFDLRLRSIFRLAFQPTSDLRRLSIFRPCL